MGEVWLCAMGHRKCSSIGVGFWASSSWVAEAPAGSALGGGGRWPHGPDWAHAVEEQDSILNEIWWVCGGDLDDQGCGELRDLSQGRRVRVPLTAMPVDRCIESAMAFWRRAGSEGRAEMGTRSIRS